MKLMFVGSANAGKTTLLLELTKKGSMVHQRIVQKGVNGKPLSTVGVELGEWEYSPKPNKEKITFMTWDFGGQVCIIGNMIFLSFHKYVAFSYLYVIEKHFI